MDWCRPKPLHAAFTQHLDAFQCILRADKAAEPLPEEPQLQSSLLGVRPLLETHCSQPMVALSALVQHGFIAQPQLTSQSVLPPGCLMALLTEKGSVREQGRYSSEQIGI